jgi:hypothetical protein
MSTQQTQRKRKNQHQKILTSQLKRLE